MTVRARAESLRFNLMAWLVIPGAVILAVSLWLSYGSAARQATLVTDRQLIASARMIAEQIQYSGGTFNVVVPPSALELFASDSHDEIAYAVIAPGDELIAGYPGLKPPDLAPPDLGYDYFQTMFRTEAMRAVILRQPVLTPQGESSLSVLVGETQKAREELQQDLWIRGFVEQALLVLAVALSIWVGISHQLRPLLRLRQKLLERDPSSFEPLDAASVQLEVRPLVQALNDHMERLRVQIERQQRFLDTAAHQLRTPLAVMKTQIGYARRTSEAKEIDEALRQVDGNLTAMSRLANQLLALARVDNEPAALAPETVDLGSLAQQVVAEAAPRALDAGRLLSFEATGRYLVEAAPLLLRELILNLVDNSIAHAGNGAVTLVSVTCAAGAAVLTVTDDGAGVAEEERALLLEPFRRGRAAAAGGSGLGLSIVVEIARAFGGTVELSDGATARGFGVVVRLPLSGREPLSAAGLPKS